MITGAAIGVITVFWYAPPTAIMTAVNLAIIGAISGGVIGGLSGLIVEVTIKRRRPASRVEPAEDAD